MEIKSVNPRLRQDQTSKELSCSSSYLQRCRQDIIMLSPYGIPLDIQEKKSFQTVNMTSKDLK